MKFIRPWTVLLIVLATTVGIAQSAADKRSVVLELNLPNGATPQLRIADGGTGTVEFSNLGKFGFVPTIRDDRNVSVDVFDLKPTPHERLDRVELVLGGDTVQSNSNPQFGIRVVRVVTP